MQLIGTRISGTGIDLATSRIIVHLRCRRRLLSSEPTGHMVDRSINDADRFIVGQIGSGVKLMQSSFYHVISWTEINIWFRKVTDGCRRARIRPSKTSIGEINSIQTDIFYIIGNGRSNRRRIKIIKIIIIIIIIRYGLHKRIRRNWRWNWRNNHGKFVRRARTEGFYCSPGQKS